MGMSVSNFALNREFSSFVSFFALSKNDQIRQPLIKIAKNPSLSIKIAYKLYKITYVELNILQIFN